MLSVPAEAGVRPIASGPPMLVQPTTSRQTAVLAVELVNDPGSGVYTAISVTNLVMPAGASLGFGAVSPTFSYPGTVEFHLYSQDGNYYFYETSSTTFADKVGSGLDNTGALLPGRTYVVTLAALLTAAQAPQKFLGYGWIIGHFPAIQGTSTAFRPKLGMASAYDLEPTVGSSLKSHGNLAGIPRGEEELSIGLLAELTGPIPVVGASCLNAARLAVDEINGAGGVRIGGRTHKLTLVTADTEGSPQKAGLLAWDFANRTDVVALIGPNASSNAIPAADIAEVWDLALITPWSTNPRTTLDPKTLLPKQDVFRVCFTNAFHGKVLSKFTRETLNAAKAAVLYDRTADVVKGLAEVFSQNFQAAGGKMVATEEYSGGETDFTAQLKRIKAAGPDVIFLPGYYTAIPVQIKQARAVGITAPLLGSDIGTEPKLIEECGTACEGVFLASHYSPESTNLLTVAFVAAYRARFGETPDDIAALTYDAFGFLRTGLEKSGIAGRQAALKGLRQVRKYQGVTGDMVFPVGSGDPVKGSVILQIKNGQLTWFADVAP